MQGQFAVQSSPARPPQWVGSADCRPSDEQAIALWAERVSREKGSAVYMHPRLALDPEISKGRPPFVYSEWNSSAGDQAGPTVLAILGRHTLPCAGVPFLPLGRSLSSLKLIGHQIVSDAVDGASDRFVEAVAGLLRDGAAECAYFEEVEVDSPLWRVLSAVNLPQGVRAYFPREPERHWWIDFPDNPAEYWKKRAGTARRRAKNLKHDVSCITTAEQVPQFLEQASAVAASSWQGKRLGSRLENTIKNRRKFEELAALGALRSYVLHQDGHPLAYMFGVNWNRCFITEEGGYDLKYMQFSPGRILTYRILEDLIEHNAASQLSMGFGDAKYKEEFCTRATMTAPVILARRSLRPMFCLGVERFRRRTETGVRRLMKETAIMQFLRRKYRR